MLAEKHVTWTNHHLSLARGEQLTPEFKKMNPRGVVPVLVHDCNVVVKSSVICSYLDEVFPDPPLMPKSPVERATMRLWCKLPDDILHMACAISSDNLLKPDLLFRVVSGRPPADIETVAELQEWRRAEDEKMLAECMRVFREQLDAAFAEFQSDMNDEHQIAQEDDRERDAAVISY